MSTGSSAIVVYGRESEELRSYWMEKLAGGIEPSSLLPDYLRSSDNHYEPGFAEARINAELRDNLSRLTGASSFLAYTAMLSALSICISRHTCNKSVIVGTPPRKKNDDSEQKPNAVAIVIPVEPGATIKELLLSVREQLLEAYAKQNYPFERLVEHLGLGGTDGRSPIFGITLAFDEIHGTLIDPRNDLNISVAGDGDGFSVKAKFNRTLFATASIEQFLSHFLLVLAEIVERRALTIAQIEMLAPTDREKLLVDWNDTRAEYSGDLCAHQLFEAQALRTPDAVALVHDGCLSYRELNNRANQLARRLQEMGVGPDVAVGICIERSLEMIVGLLGILKSGGAYVPLDPAYPKERLAFIVQETGLPVLLTQQRLLSALPEHSAEVLCLDSERHRIGRYSADNFDSGASPSNLAYLIYTSGSTGAPKGVMISHESLCARTASMIEKYRLGAGERMLQFVSLSFDASIEEIFPTLLSGASLALMSSPGRLSVSDLLLACENSGVTALHIPPSYWTQIVDSVVESGGAVPKWINLFITGGETVPPDKLAAWLKHTRHSSRFIAAYGPTEAAITSTIYQATSEFAEESQARVPIGRPLSNTEIYLLDSELRLVPVGTPGELFVGGVGLSRGYFNAPEITAERFIPHPFGASGERLYAGRDLARYLPDGNIDFLGRTDDQVKIHGYRIELGEIEAVLTRNSVVKDAAVIAREDQPGEKRLVAYVILSEGADASGSDLRSFAKESLPEYMVPSAFVMLDVLPRTPNGKVDRKALPPPDGLESRSGAMVLPRTHAETVLAGIWAELLGKDEVGIYDNFFELGGHSLLATRVVSRIREAFNVEIALRNIFEGPTVAELACVVEEASGAGESSSAPPMVRVSREGNLPLSFAQQRLWFLDQLHPGTPLFNMPGAFRLSGLLDVDAFERALGEVVRRHEILRTTFNTVDSRPVQVIAPPSHLTLPVVDLRSLNEEQREKQTRRLATQEGRRPFDLSRGPLFRVLLVEAGESDHALLFTLHHIVSDGWSMEVLIREVTLLYEAFAQGTPSLLPELSLQYADFAHWQQHWMRDEVLDRHLAYWTRQLAEIPVLQLQADRPRPEMQTFDGGFAAISVPEDVSREVVELGRRTGCTTFMTALAAFQILLHYYAGQDEIVVGTDVANRNRVETEGLIGFFINQLVLRTDLSGDPELAELFVRVRETTLGAYAHQDLPFEKLVEVLKPERAADHSPLFQVKLILQNAPARALEIPGLSLSPIGATRGRAELDLTMALWETAAGLQGWINYRTELFDAATVERMAEHLEALFKAFVQKPGARLSEFTGILAERDRRRSAALEADFEQASLGKLKRARRRSVSETTQFDRAMQS